MAQREELEHVQSAVAAALSGLARRGVPSALQPIWSRCAGAAAAGASHPSAFDRGVLSVEVETPAWLGALEGQRGELEARLAEALPGFARLELHLRGGRR